MKPSSRACAISMRSKGSLCGPGKRPAASAWGRAETIFSADLKGARAADEGLVFRIGERIAGICGEHGETSQPPDQDVGVQ